jgi:ribosomal protein S12 methylthiotransferase
VRGHLSVPGHVPLWTVPRPRVAMVTLGCSRNEVDSEEMAGRLAADGWDLVPEAADADAVLVNTCGFVEAAKKDSIDALLAAADLKPTGQGSSERGPKAVVAVGCMAERYGRELAASLPEADAVLGFDHYEDLGARLRGILAGEKHEAHTPRDRRLLLPIVPTDRPASAANVSVPGMAGESRRRLDSGPSSPLKLASGCDRRCSFCAIPSFRGSFVSRPAVDVMADAGWLATQGVREVFLVSENTTSYGKDLGDLRLLETLLPALTQVEGIEWVRASYLQPAELRPGLVEVIAGTPGVVPYFDLSFQHSSPSVLRRMRRFGGTEDFLGLVDRVRHLSPHAGIRSNVIVGFPGETEADFEELERFLSAARLDVVGVFGYSDEDGTEAESFEGKLPQEVIDERVSRISTLVTELMSQRAEDRIGTQIEVLVESVEAEVLGRGEHQAPEVDGQVSLRGAEGLKVGDLVRATVVDTDGADLIAEVKAGSAR